MLTIARLETKWLKLKLIEVESENTTSSQVTLSKFHALNFKIGAMLPFWTLLKKVHAWRSKQQGSWTADKEGETGAGDGENAKEEATEDTVAALLKKLKQLQQQEHTLDLAAAIFSDDRVRQLGYMFLE